MPPPIPVYSQLEIKLKYPYAFDASKKDCKLYELVQSQCTFDNSEVICLPFKRIFARCPAKDDGKDGTKGKRAFFNVEITDVNTNDYDKFNDSYKKEHQNKDILKKFLEADKVMRQAYNREVEQSDE